MKVILSVFAAALLSLGTLTSTPQAIADTPDAPLCGCEAVKGGAKAHAQKPKVGDAATCPVTKHAFKVTAKTTFSQYKGKWYAFCCGDCKPKFDADPAKYASR